MRFGKGGHPSSVVGSYVLVGLCMQLGENLHMQAREPGGLGGGRVFWRSEGKGSYSFFGGESSHQKRFLLEVPSMGDRLTMEGCGYVCQSHIKKASSISEKLRITFICFQCKKWPPFRTCNRKKPG